MPIQAQTTANDLVKEIEFLTNSSPYYVGLDNLEWRRLTREAVKVRAVEPHMGWALFGMLYARVGDFEQMNRAYRTSLDLLNDETTIANWTANLVSLGFFTEAQELFAQYAHPKKGMFSYLYQVGIIAFSYRQAALYLQIAEGMSMDIGSLSTPMAEAINSFLEAHDVSDAQIAKHFDVAGEIMRKRGIVFSYQTNLTNMDGLHHGITVAIDVPVSQEEAFDMNIELAMAEEKFQIEKHPSFDLVFAAE
jgi:hypothetical protein